MLRTSWRPFGSVWSEMNRLQEHMNRLFGRAGDVGEEPGVHVYPALNAWEDENKLYVEAEMPGLDIDELEVFVTGANELSINGERKAPEGFGENWHRRERGFGKFSRLFSLPMEVDAKNVEASYHDGILRIEMPKREELKPRRIEVNRG